MMEAWNVCLVERRKWFVIYLFVVYEKREGPLTVAWKKAPQRRTIITEFVVLFLLFLIRVA
jgi:hypothetical protein